LFTSVKERVRDKEQTKHKLA